MNTFSVASCSVVIHAFVFVALYCRIPYNSADFFYNNLNVQCSVLKIKRQKGERIMVNRTTADIRFTQPHQQTQKQKHTYRTQTNNSQNSYYLLYFTLLYPSSRTTLGVEGRKSSLSAASLKAWVGGMWWVVSVWNSY